MAANNLTVTEAVSHFSEYVNAREFRRVPGCNSNCGPSRADP